MAMVALDLIGRQELVFDLCYPGELVSDYCCLTDTLMSDRFPEYIMLKLEVIR